MLTRQITLDEPVNDERSVYRLGCWLLLVDRPLRLLGLGASGLTEMRLRQLLLPLKQGD